MTDKTPNLGLTYILASQADKHVWMNENMSTLDALVQSSVRTRSQTAQPATPTQDESYILPVGKTGSVWSALPDHSIAIWRDGAWLNYPVRTGFMIYVESEAKHLVRAPTGWLPLQTETSLNQSQEVLVNGGLSIWQRGTNTTLLAGQSGFSADRWRHEAGIGGVATLSKIAINPVSENLPQWSNVGLRHAQTTSATSSPCIEQRIEALRRFGGTKVTLSAFLRVVSGSINVTPRAHLNFGIAGPSSVSFVGSAWALTTLWQRFSCTFDIPPIGNYTNSDLANNFLSLGIDLPSNQSFSVEATAWQVDWGGQFLPCRASDPVNELRRCQRYFCKTFAQNTPPSSNSNDGGGIFPSVYSTGAYSNTLPWHFPTAMRATPFIATYNPYSPSGTGMSLVGGGNHPVEVYIVNQNGVSLRNSQTLPGAQVSVNLHATADAEL
jgi:hypothetical protein